MLTWIIVAITVAVIVLVVCLCICCCCCQGLLCKRCCCQERSQEEKIHNGIQYHHVPRNVDYDVESQRRLQRSIVQSQNRKQINVNYNVESENKTQRSETELFKSAQKIYLETPSTGYPKLDLHNYSLDAAMAIFKVFLQISKTEYKRNNHIRSKRFTLVITGKGLHSPNGIPIIKPAVENYLKAHNYTFNWSNPGMVRIDLLPFKKQN